MSRPSRQAHFAGPTAGVLRLENRHTREVLILRRMRHGDQVFLELEGSVPPKGEGPPLHVHLIEREEGEVVAGVMSAVVGGAAIKVRAGESAVFPAGVPHRWWNAEDQPLQTKGRVVPIADLDRFLQGIFAVANAGQAGRMPLFYVAQSCTGTAARSASQPSRGQFGVSCSRPSSSSDGCSASIAATPGPALLSPALAPLKRAPEHLRPKATFREEGLPRTWLTNGPGVRPTVIRKATSLNRNAGGNLFTIEQF